MAVMLLFWGPLTERFAFMPAFALCPYPAFSKLLRLFVFSRLQRQQNNITQKNTFFQTMFSLLIFNLLCSFIFSVKIDMLSISNFLLQL